MARSPCPAGLIAIRDLLDRLPDRQTEILEAAIEQREQDLLLYQSVRDVTRFHVWDAFKSAFANGAIVFLLAMLVGQVATLAQWLQNLKTTKILLPLPIMQDFRLDLGPYIPTSTVIGYAARLPVWDTRDALIAALVLMSVLLFIRFWFGLLIWKRSRGLSHASERVEDELTTLRSWQTKIR